MKRGKSDACNLKHHYRICRGLAMSCVSVQEEKFCLHALEQLGEEQVEKITRRQMLCQSLKPLTLVGTSPHPIKSTLLQVVFPSSALFWGVIVAGRSISWFKKTVRLLIHCVVLSRFIFLLQWVSFWVLEPLILSHPRPLVNYSSVCFSCSQANPHGVSQPPV